MSDAYRNFSAEQFSEAHGLVNNLRGNIAKILIGQNAVVEHVLMALIAGGHVLIEGVPGLGKTLLVKTLARCIGGEYSRSQFTPDLMPSDITGHSIYDIKNEKFEFRKGPIFTNFLLADEINRAPAKTQAALLEVMQEHQVSIDGQLFVVTPPFMVLATQNPIEQEGTYPLPEAELDRFMMKVLIDYPEVEDELRLVFAVTSGSTQEMPQVDHLDQCLSQQELISVQNIVSSIEVDERVLRYCVDIVRATRNRLGIVQGAGPRGSISLIKAAKSKAIISGRPYVVPDDVSESVLPVLRHRIALSAELEIEGLSTSDVLIQLIEEIDAPRL